MTCATPRHVLTTPLATLRPSPATTSETTAVLVESVMSMKRRMPALK
jgi:hypothetical protein